VIEIGAQMMVRVADVLLAGMLGVAGGAALAATPPLLVERGDNTHRPSQAAAGLGATVPLTSASAKLVPSGNPLWAIPLRQLSATRERPLFAPSRRPPPPIVEYQPAPIPPPTPLTLAEPEKPRMSLLGTVARGADGIGVFVDQNTKIVLRLRIGEDHEGWVLRSVQRREVTLMKGRESANLSLPLPGLTKSDPLPPPSATAAISAPQVPAISAPRVPLPGSTLVPTIARR
jgi:hypothetical protein